MTLLDFVDKHCEGLAFMFILTVLVGFWVWAVRSEL